MRPLPISTAGLPGDLICVKQSKKRCMTLQTYSSLLQKTADKHVSRLIEIYTYGSSVPRKALSVHIWVPKPVCKIKHRVKFKPICFICWSYKYLASVTCNKICLSLAYKKKLKCRICQHLWHPSTYKRRLGCILEASHKEACHVPYSCWKFESGCPCSISRASPPFGRATWWVVCHESRDCQSQLLSYQWTLMNDLVKLGFGVQNCRASVCRLLHE